MSEQRSEDGWWQSVYTGPAGTLPDTPLAEADAGTVDDWFDTAAGVIRAQRSSDEQLPTVDEWFDSALGMIGPQRTSETVPDDRSATPPTEEPDGKVSAPMPLPETAVAEAPEAPAAPDPEEIAEPDDDEPASFRRPRPEPPVPHVGERPPTYGAEPTAVPAADPEALSIVVPDTVIDGAEYANATLRAASVRGDSARYRGEPRRDALLVTRFGEGEDGLLLAVLAAPGRGEPAADGSAAANEAARQLAAAIGRSQGELSADLRAGARDRLRYGLQRLAVRAAALLRTEADDAPLTASGSLHCLLISLDRAATHRVAFGTGPGGLYLLRSGHWIDAYAARLLHHPDGEPPLPPGPADAPRPFRFRLVPATPGDILLLSLLSNSFSSSLN